MSTLGSLIVTLEANVAKFESDLGRGAAMAEAAMNKIAKAVSKVSDDFKMLAGGFGVYELVHFGGEVLQAAASLEGFHKQTGLSIEALSAMQNEAAKTGENISEVAMAFTRLEKNAGAAATGNHKLLTQFEAIGMSLDTLKQDLQDPDKLLMDMAKSLEKYADNAYKADVATALMGRGGAQYLEFLHQMAVDGLSAATATEEQVKAAQHFEFALAQLSTKMKAWGLTFMTDLVPGVRMFSIALLQVFEELQIRMITGSRIANLTILKQLQELDDTIINKSGNAVRKLFGMAPHKLQGDVYGDQIKELKSNALADIAASKDMLAEEAQKFADIGKVQPPDDRPNAPLTAGGKPDKLSHVNDGLVKAMDERLKVLDAALKREASIEKYFNLTVDTEYKHHMISLADYSFRKAEILQSTFRRTQAIYDEEIATAKSYISRINAELAKEKGRKVDSTQETQQASVIAAKQAELEQAASKLAALGERKAESGITYKDTGIKTNEEVSRNAEAQAKAILDVDIAYATMTGNLALANKLQAEMNDRDKAAIFNKEQLTKSTAELNAIQERNNQLALLAASRPITDTNIAYLNLIGNTEEATRLQIELDDEMVRYELTARGAFGALQQLQLLEKDRLLQASTNGWDGIIRSAQAYGKSIENVAAQTAAMTTKMLKSVEDGIVQFVHTGKLNWKSMIDAMLVDLIRLEVQKRIMGFISMAVGAAAGYGGSAAAGVGGAAANFDGSLGTGMATGGAVNQGQQYTVGERGPEQFVPSVQGAIVPNGSGGAQSITYAPTIQIDSRSDRAQVQADIVDTLRANNRELVGILKRYNPGLRT